MGISREASVEEAVLSMRRRRRYRTEVHNSIEAELLVIKEKMRNNEEDLSMWKR